MGVVAGQQFRRGEIYLVNLSPSLGGEIQKSRPCLVVSPDELNRHLKTLIVAPMTTGSHRYPFRVPCRFRGRSGHVVLDQIRTVDRDRLLGRLGRLSSSTLKESLAVLQEMFSP
jgi:mRNA interferase MazF